MPAKKASNFLKNNVHRKYHYYTDDLMQMWEDSGDDEPNEDSRTIEGYLKEHNWID